MVGTRAIVPPSARKAGDRRAQRFDVTDDLHRLMGLR